MIQPLSWTDSRHDPTRVTLAVIAFTRMRRLNYSCSQADRAPVVADIARAAGWEKLWDATLDEGSRCVQRLKRLVKSACHRCFDGACPCEHKEVTKEMIDSLSNLSFQFLKDF